jgi:hypothetical protein
MAIRIGITLLFAFASLGLKAQHLDKSDYVWVLGGAMIDSATRGGFLINFHTKPPTITYSEIPMLLMGVAPISDPEGNLLFYSNGCFIANKKHQIMMNGQGINEGYIATVYCQEMGGYPTGGGLIALPMPGDPSKFILFHIWIDNNARRRRVLYSQVDIEADHGLGAVTQKNMIALEDTVSDYISAVKHGNGRDWWIIVPKWMSNRYYVFLLDPTGVHPPLQQHIGPVWWPRDWSGQAVFSPDGTKYVRANPENGLQIFDFDRCTGRLSKPLVIPSQSNAACGVAFSPSSRYLYLSTGSQLFQFDMHAPHIPNSRKLVGQYDGFMGPLPTTFYQMMLTPDGKIYMGATNGVRYLHVIHEPDSVGLACNLVQRDIETPVSFSWVLPNLPHFRLYDWPDSPCDTLGINGGPWWTSAKERLSVLERLDLAPNPAQEYVRLRFPKAFSGTVQIRDASGREVLRQAINAVEQETIRIDVPHLPAGVYYVCAIGERDLFRTEKLVVVR